MRTRTLLLSAVVITVAPIWIAGLAAGGSPRDSTGSAPAPVVSSSGADEALKLLSRWDHRRSVAWSRADPVALARLYTSRSRTGDRDVTDLERWRRRGLRVIGLRQQVTALLLAARTRDRLVVVVTDRTVGGIARGAGRRTTLPGSAWATHRIVLRHSGDGWRVVEARVERAA
jgi:hypothetical protein